MVRFLLPLLALLAATPALAAPDSWRDCLQEESPFPCLLGLEVDNTGNLEFEQALADAARNAGKPGYAAIVLERIVSRYPEQAGARLELVILSMNAGDNLTAEYHLKILQAHPNPPPQVGALLRELESRLKPVEQAFDSKTRFLGSLGLGYDTNPNLGVIADAIDLVINGSAQTLVPDGSLTPHPAFFAGLSASGEYIYSPKGLISANILAREYEGLADQDSVATSARAFHKLRSNRYLEAVLADFRTGEGLYLTRAGAGARQRFGSCQCNTVGLLLDLLDGSERSNRASRLTLDVQTARKWGPATVRFYGSADYSNQPDAQWGDTLGLELGANAVGYFAGFRGSFGLTVYRGEDDDPYSPLFGTRQRDLQRGSIKLGLSHPVADNIDVFLDWSYSRQDSDVALFEYERQVSAIGLKVAF
jgi:hypothetical protein